MSDDKKDDDAVEAAIAEGQAKLDAALEDAQKGFDKI